IAQVGEGTYGKVYKAKYRTTGKLVALKRFRLESEKEGFPITAMREIKLLRSMKHPNILRLFETLTARTDGSIYMIFEYMDYDLAGLLAHPRGWPLGPPHIKCLMQQMLAGLAYLHQSGILHRDIKGSNLLLNRAGQLKYADFGLARRYDPMNMHDYTNRVITLWYRPPELLLGATLYGPPADVWGLGCLFIEFFTRKALFTGVNEVSQLDCIYRILGTPTATPPPHSRHHVGEEDDINNDDKRARTPAYISESALHLIESLLAYSPQRRLTAVEALQHPYFTEEAPAACRPEEIPLVEGDWHEFEYKANR
ncbi:Pkinase-domain-containing protein, partial [Dimargaris cristalligena]